MLSRIVSNRTVYMYEKGIGFKYPTIFDMPLYQTKLDFMILLPIEPFHSSIDFFHPEHHHFDAIRNEREKFEIIKLEIYLFKNKSKQQ